MIIKGLLISNVFYFSAFSTCSTIVTLPLTMKAVTEVSGASDKLVMMSIILKAVGLPLEGVAMILAVDRTLDMFRTAVNAFSDSVGAVVISRLEGNQ